MKYKRYILSFSGDGETVAFLNRKVRLQRANLGEARRIGRAAEELFGVRYEVKSVTVPNPTVSAVKSI